MKPARPIMSTYRFQLTPDFTFDDAAAQVGYLAQLGVTHLYLSPVLQATAGSTHGYDVVDHSRYATGLGGEDGFRRLVAAAHGAGLGLVVDIVPNHMVTPVPVSLSAPLWSLLREGSASPYATWFDIDWAAEDGKVLWPVLGSSLGEALAAGEITVARVGGEDVVRYYDHVLPLAPGTDVGRMPLGSVLEQQHYRLATWREASTRLNYRRFFDVTALIGLRVEDPEVFDATHRLVVEAVRAEDVDGLRIDHPDGLADPQGYLDRLGTATAGAWTVVEKILEGPETLPRSWRTAGTTGYDALLRVCGLFVDPEGKASLEALSEELLGERQDLGAMSADAKVHIVREVLGAEVNRIVRVIARALPDTDLDDARSVVEALLVGMDRYRIYVRPGEARAGLEAAELVEAFDRGRGATGARVDGALAERLVDLAVGECPDADPAAQDEFMVRLQQTCGPVMAKAVEDTTFYRFVRLVALNEVGGDPDHVGTSPDEFHWFAESLMGQWPTTMTTLTTHDTKRSEDVRARLAVLAERPAEWAAWVRRAWRLGEPHRSGGRLDPLTEYFLWQNLVGAWPIDVERLGAYALKAVREAKLHTAWVDGDPGYEEVVAHWCAAVVADAEIQRHLDSWLAHTAVEARANTLGQKVVQLLMPGIPDVYQGTELVDLSLVDPDNRRAVDYADRASRIARLGGGGTPQDVDDEKLRVTADALRLRRDRPGVFVGEQAGYARVPASSEHLVGFRRGDGGQEDVVVLATRLAGRLTESGGWGSHTMDLPEGTWRDVLSGRTTRGGKVEIEGVLAAHGSPVAILVRGGVDRS